MGIRVNIVLGYGLTDVETDGRYSITDTRINTGSPLLDYDRECEVSIEAYREFLKSESSKKTRGFCMESGFLDPEHWMGENVTKRPSSLHECVTYDSECGMSNVLCVTPAWLYHDWHRRDDSIDYAVASYVMDSNPENKVWPLDYGIFPFNGTYVDKRTGERVDSEILTWVRMLDGGKKGRWRVKKQLRKSWDPHGHEAMNILAQNGGFASHEDAMENCRPTIPEEIQNLVTFGNLFTDSSTVLELRPMIYQFWS